jgi:hypothetical protein
MEAGKGGGTSLKAGGRGAGRDSGQSASGKRKRSRQ